MRPLRLCFLGRFLGADRGSGSRPSADESASTPTLPRRSMVRLFPMLYTLGGAADTTRRGPSICHTVTITIRISVCAWPQSDAEAPSLLRLSKNNQILQCIDHAFQ